MPSAKRESTVLTIRVDSCLERALTGEAQRRHMTRSELVRELLVAGLGDVREAPDLVEEAQRQSLLVSGRASERDALELIEHAADTRGWE